MQLRGLGVIDSNKIGASTLRTPMVMGGGTVETVPATTGYPTVPTSTGGSGGGARATYGRGDIAVMTNAAQPSYPVMQPNAPSVEPPLPEPAPLPPMATNPANSSMPAPSGTQVTMQPAEPWNPRWYKWGMSPKLWGLAALAALGVGVGVVLHRRR